MKAHSDAKLGVQGGGSGTGLTQVAAGAVDIGDSDLFAAEKLPADQASALVDHQVCITGFAAVVNADVAVKSLTSDQLIAIFTGKTTNWKDVGGKDEKIVILNRPTSSGTRATFKKYALNGQDEAQGVALTEDASGTVAKTVDSTPGSISYLALSYINSSANTYKNVKMLQFNGIDATAANIQSGKYPIWSIEHMYTKGEATGTAKDFLAYMMSSDFSQYVTQLGYIPSSAMDQTVLASRTK
jgi:phosphate binding protein